MGQIDVGTLRDDIRRVREGESVERIYQERGMTGKTYKVRLSGAGLLEEWRKAVNEKRLRMMKQAKEELENKKGDDGGMEEEEGRGENPKTETSGSKASPPDPVPAGPNPSTRVQAGNRESPSPPIPSGNPGGPGVKKSLWSSPYLWAGIGFVVLVGFGFLIYSRSRDKSSESAKSPGPVPARIPEVRSEGRAEKTSRKRELSSEDWEKRYRLPEDYR